MKSNFYCEIKIISFLALFDNVQSTFPNPYFKTSTEVFSKSNAISTDL